MSYKNSARKKARSKVQEVVGVSYFDTNCTKKSFPVLNEPTVPLSLLSVLSATAH